jgi:membrane-associated PAP2 superfamily phosphatase
MNTLKLNPWTGFLLPILLFLAAAPWLSELDLSLSRFFYHDGLFSQHDFWDAIYRYGIIPAWLTVGAALVGLALSFYPSNQRWRLPCLYLILTLAIGSGLIVHAGLKENWQRPRPRQVEEFGGTEPFRPFYQPNLANSSKPLKSFSSGHSTMGFYFFSVAILGAVLQNAMLYWGGMSVAWGLGGLLSLARIAQGGHFLSDVLASALIMWLVAWSLAYLFFIYLRKGHARTDSKAI